MKGEGTVLNAGLLRVAWHCRKLERLFLQGCGTTDRILREFATLCPLTCVAVTGEPGITDAGVWSLRLRLRSLERLALLANDQLTEIPHSG